LQVVTSTGEGGVVRCSNMYGKRTGRNRKKKGIISVNKNKGNLGAKKKQVGKQSKTKRKGQTRKNCLKREKVTVVEGGKKKSTCGRKRVKQKLLGKKEKDQNRKRRGDRSTVEGGGKHMNVANSEEHIIIRVIGGGETGA